MLTLFRTFILHYAPSTITVLNILLLSGCHWGFVKTPFPEVPKEFLSTPKTYYLLSEEQRQVTAKQLISDAQEDLTLLQSVQLWLKKQQEVK